MHRLIAALAVIALPSVAAPPKTQDLVGGISDPSLRRKVELVYVEKVEGTFAPPPAPQVMNQVRNVYVPRLLPVVVGTKVEFRSEDPELHNVFGRGEKKVLFNQGVPPRGSSTLQMKEAGVVKLSCNIHREMVAFIPVLQNPYWAQPDPKTGAFTIKALPKGKYVLRIWGEKLSDEDKARQYPIAVGDPSAAPVQLANR